MRRRALLASLGVGIAGLAGCVGSAADTETTTTTGDTTTDDQTTTETATPDEDTHPVPPEGAASIVDLETGPRTYAFRPVRRRTEDGGDLALWFDQTATADGPATLTGYLQNANDFENTFRVQWLAGVGNVHARQPADSPREARLHLAPTENNDLATEVPELVRDESGYWRVSDVGPWLRETYRMDPGEVVRLEYAVVGGPEMPGRPTGTYTIRGGQRTVSIGVWNTDHPGPDGDSRFAGRTVPDFDGDQQAAWFHDADASTLVYVEPSTERLDLDGLVEFDVVNHSRERLGCGHWNLHKLVDGEWFHVGPVGHTADCRQLSPGERKTWSLRAFNGEPVACSADCGGGYTRGYLGGGEYAVVAGYGHPADESAALVEFVGDPVEVVPTEDATVDRDGATLTVTTEQYGDDEHPPDATLTVERADDADERLLAEQLLAGGAFDGVTTPYGALWNAVAGFEDGVETVVVRSDEHDVGAAVGYAEDGQRRFSVRGQAYVATAAQSND